MEQQKEKRDSSRLRFWLRLILYVCALAALVVPFVIQYDHRIDHNADWSLWVPLACLGFAVLAVYVLRVTLPTTDATEESQARERVRKAEDNLSSALRNVASPGVINTGAGTLHISNAAVGDRATVRVPDGEQSDSGGDGGRRDKTVKVDEDVRTAATKTRAILSERRDDRLTLAALWDVTHGRMDLYHQIVTGQARRSFIAAQVAMGIGFVLLVVFAVLAAEAKTTAAAVGAGGLGAVGAAFAAYIGKTFIRSQESAASHLRAYFDQPLELSRYLAAERLLADAGDLTAEQRAAIISSLVQSIATAGHENGSAKDAKPTGRQPRGRASR